MFINALKPHIQSLSLHNFDLTATKKNETAWARFFNLTAIILLIPTCTNISIKTSHFSPCLSIVIFVQPVAAVHKLKLLSVNFSPCPFIWQYRNLYKSFYTSSMDTCKLAPVPVLMKCCPEYGICKGAKRAIKGACHVL